MADAVLDFLTQLSKTLVISFWNEDWVVAEAFGTMLLGGDMAVYDTLELVDFLDAGAAARTYILLFDVADDGAEAAWRFSLPSSSLNSLAMLASLSWSVPSA